MNTKLATFFTCYSHWEGAWEALSESLLCGWYSLLEVSGQEEACVEGECLVEEGAYWAGFCSARRA